MNKLPSLPINAQRPLTAPLRPQSRISLAIVALMATYAISIGCVLWRRLTIPESLPPTKWSLGRRGVLVNGLGLAYAIYSFFWAFWPIYWNPTPAEVNEQATPSFSLSATTRQMKNNTDMRGPQMNFAIVIFSGVMLLSAVNYFVSAHRKYTGPVATCEGRQDG